MNSDHKQKRPLRSIGVFLIVGILAGVGIGYQLGRSSSQGAREDHASDKSQSNEPVSQKTLYTCGMHPEVIQDTPGDCPKCGMKLTPMDPDRARTILEARGESVADASSTQSALSGGPTIRIDPVTEQNMGVRYDVVRTGPLEKTVRTVATVDYDENGQGTATTKVDGWVEKVYVDQTGTQVHKGDPLFEFYSPQLFSAREEYLVALKDLENARSRQSTESIALAQRRADSAKERLLYFDIAPDQIETLEKEGTVRKTMTVRSQLTGIVVQKGVVEGDFIKAGAPAYRISDLSNVWVIGKVFESDLPFVRLGQEAHMTLDYLPGRIYRGRVTYIYPYLEKGSREIPLRVEFHNPGYDLKPGMYATIELKSQLSDKAVLVPDTAVILTGERQIAYVLREPGKFEPRKLTLGPRGDANEWQVLSGLTPGETVVVSGQFLLDSESRLREATLKMMNAGKVDAQSVFTSSEEKTEKVDAPSTGREEIVDKYVCPMPAHAGILYDEMGDCPLCKMKLVPVHPWNVNQSPVSYYTCPMQEHSDVHESAPGKCPKCGMTLIPITKDEEKRFQEASPQEKALTLYTCPMASHADVVSDEPGKCPKCNMTLVPTSKVGHGNESEALWRETHGSPTKQ